MWALGNILGDSPESHHELLSTDFVSQTLKLLSSPVPPEVMRVTSWAMGLAQKFGPVLPFLVPMRRLLLSATADSEVSENLLRGYEYLTRDPACSEAEIAVQIPAEEAIWPYLGSDKVLFKILAVRIVDNMCSTGRGETITRTLKSGVVIRAVAKMLEKERDERVLCEAIGTVADIACGYSRDVQRLLDADIIKRVRDLVLLSPISIRVSSCLV